MGLFGKKKAKPSENENKVDEFTMKMIQNSEYFIEEFKGRFGGGLDFSEKSLSLVEEILNEASEFKDEMPEQKMKWIINVVGSYVFEVARRTYGGKYLWLDQRNQPVLVTGQPEFDIAIVVFDKIKGRIENGVEDNIPFFFQGYSERVKNARPGDSAMIV